MRHKSNIYTLEVTQHCRSCHYDHLHHRPRIDGREFNFEAMVRAFRLGVHGYIVRNISCEPLIGSLQLIAMGEKVMPSELANALPFQIPELHGEDTQRSILAAKLSERENEILRCLIVGFPNKMVTRRMGISEATVKVHVKAILRKLLVQNRTQAAIWAVKQGLKGYNSLSSVLGADAVTATLVPKDFSRRANRGLDRSVITAQWQPL